MSDLATRLNRLSPEARALLEKRIRAPEARVARSAAEEPAPLSYSQERFWFIEQLFPGAPMNNIAGLNSFFGRFEPELFYRAAELIVARHEALRTAVVVTAGQPRQQVRPPYAIERKVVEIPALERTRRGTEAERMVREDAARPFDLPSGVLLRLTVFRCSELEHRVLICLHHVAGDAWSAAIVVGELMQAYGRLARGLAPDLPLLPGRYADFAVSQRRQASVPEAAKRVDFWVEHLRGAPPQLDLATDRPRGEGRTPRGGRVALQVPEALAARLRRFAADEGLTPFMVLLGAYAALLHRYSGQDDLVIGVPVSGRDRPGTQQLVGCFLNLIALRIDATGSPAFRAFLARLRARLFSAFEHADVPFEVVMNRLRPGRSGNSSPLFQAAFSYEREPAADVAALPDLGVVYEELDLGMARYDLALELTEGREGIKGWLDFSRDLFDGDSIERMARHFLELLADALDRPDERLRELRLIPPEERRCLLEDWNRTGRPLPRAATVHGLFAEQAARRPAAIALIEGDRRLSYGELDRRGELLAGQLRRRGAGPGSPPVALCLGRSIEAIVAILGVLKAGGAYLPVDLAHPPARVGQILDESGATLAVTTSAQAQRLDWLQRLTWLAVDQVGEEGAPGTPPPAPVSPHDLAYVMYTSGSSGRPKGVAVSHRNIIRLVRETDYAAFGENEVGLLQTQLTFDPSTFEIWGALLHGGALVIAPPGSLEIDRLVRLLGEHRVTNFVLITGPFQSVVEEAIEGLRPLRHLRQLVVGGDAMPRAPAEKLLRALPGCRLINAYGPTECTTIACCHAVDLADPPHCSVPIGRPIANTAAYVLDRHRQLAPVGVPGELYLGGEGLARGYFNRPDLTADRFVANPFGAPGSRLYRTGDRVRLLADGRIEFHGRIDRQVKMRGFRIELGEIEAVLSSHPGLREAAVMVRGDGPAGARRLCAYVVPAAAARPAADELRDFLRAQLPDYMVPSSFTFLEGLPFSAHGKVEASRLPAPESAPERAWEEPRGEAEAKLAEVWRSLFQTEKIGRNDNFFELGGDSVLVIQLVSRAARAGLRLEARDPFLHQSIAELASAARAAAASPDRSPAAATASAPFPLSPLGPSELEALFDGIRRLRPAARIEDALKLSPLQEGVLFDSISSPGADHYLVQLVSRLDGAVDAAALEQAWLHVVDRHPALRTGFHHEGLGCPVQVIERPAEAGWRIADLPVGGPAAEDTEFLRYAERDRAEGLELSVPGPGRLHLVRFGSERARLLWTYHHIALDGWSAAAVQRELFAAYRALRSGGTPLLPPARPFRDFIAEIDQRDRKAALAAWRDYLAGFEEPTPLPPRQESRGGAGPVESPLEAALELEATSALAEGAKSRRLTLATVVQGAWALVLGSLSGRKDVVFGTPVSGRDFGLEGSESMVGMFIGTFPVRVRIDPRLPLAGLLGETQRNQSTLRAHRHCGLMEIQGVTAVPRGRPLFESLVVVENFHDGAPLDGDAGLRGSQFEPVPREFPIVTLVAVPGPRLRLRLFYDRTRDSGPGMRFILDCLMRLLREMPGAWDKPVGSLGAPTEPPAAPAGPAGAPEGTPPRRRVLLPLRELESRLGEIWAELLEVERCGPDDNFYQLGGHSLLYMRMRGRLLQGLGLDVSVVDLLRHPTVRQLARYLTEADASEADIADSFGRAEGRRDRTAARRRRPWHEDPAEGTP